MIHSEVSGSVRIIRMEHGKANTIDVEFFGALEEALKAASHESCRSLVLTGTGSIFSAGVDLYRVVEGGADYLDELLPQLTTGLRRLFEFPKPVVAAINGHAIAGGCILACACDHRLMAQGTGRIGVPELRVGVPFPTTALEIVRFVVSDRNFQEVIYGGHTYSVDEALARGLLDASVDPADLMEQAVEAAKQLGALATEAFAASKAQLRRSTLDRIVRHARHFDAEVERIWKAPETHQAIRDYLRETLGR